MNARWDDEVRRITFHIAKRAIRTSLPELPPLVYRETHGAFEAALARTRDPVRVRLPLRIAKELLHWVIAAAVRHKEARTPDATALMEAVESLQVAIRSPRNP